MTEQLNSKLSLIDKVECFLPEKGYVDVSQYEKIRISIYASTILKISLEWSPDGITAGPNTCFRCGSLMWKSDVYEPIMPYLKIHVINESGQQCEELNIHTWSPGYKATSNEPIVKITPRSMVPVLEEIKPTIISRNSSPFSCLKRNKKIKDDRLPEYIPQGSILMGGFNNNITCIPKGLVGEYLMMLDTGPSFSLPYPPRN